MEIQNCIAVEQFTEEIKVNRAYFGFCGNRRNFVEIEEILWKSKKILIQNLTCKNYNFKVYNQSFCYNYIH